MEKFRLIIDQIKEKENQQKINDLFSKIAKTYPQLDTTVKWNQPIFTDHGTFIIAFSLLKIIFPSHQKKQRFVPLKRLSKKLVTYILIMSSKFLGKVQSIGN